MLRVDGLHAGYGDLAVVHGIDLEVAAGEVIALIGSNGAGKSTVLRAVSGLLPPTAGRVTFDGRSISGVPAFRIARAGLTYVPADRRLFRELSVADNLLMGAYPRRPSRQRLEEAVTLFPRLAQRRRQRAGTLSGGEQQMLAIARALMSEPKLLLLDEPSLGLAPLIVKQIFNAISAVNRERGMTVFLVEQNAFHALRLAHKGYVIVNGVITLSGTGRELLANEEVRSAYLEGGH